MVCCVSEVVFLNLRVARKIFLLLVPRMDITYVDDGLDDGDDAVHDGHEAAGDRVDHGVELRRLLVI